MGTFGVASTALVTAVAAGLGTLLLVAQLRKLRTEFATY